jgi:restriction endonuclease S subunit
MDTRYPIVRLGKALALDIDAVTVDPSNNYNVAGIFSFGRGMFARGPITGTETNYNSLNRLHSGNLVLSRLKAFEGAVAVVPDRFEGWFLSQEFPTFSCIPDVADPLYIGYLCQWPTFWELLADASEGLGARRERVHPEDLLAIAVPLPDIEEQRRVAARIKRVFGRVEEGVSTRQARRDILNQVPWAVFAACFRDLRKEYEVRPLDSVVSVNPEPWDPSESTTPTFTYLDIGAIEKGKARITDVVEIPVAEAPVRARRRIRANDVVTSTVRPNLRGTTLIPPDLDGAVCSSGFAVLRPREILPEFLLMQMLSPTVVDQLSMDARGGHYPAVTDARLRHSEILVPPHDVQEFVARRLAKLLDRVSCGFSLDDRVAELQKAVVASVLNSAFAGAI